MTGYRPHPRQRGDAWDAAPTVLENSVLRGAHAVVTGAGTGIGRAVSVRLGALGAHVTGIGRTSESLVETQSLVESAGRGSFSGISADVRDSAGLRDAIDQAADGVGIDLLVNNAGGQFYAAADDISDNGFRSVVDLNLNAVFTAISAAKPHMASRGGSIINISLSGVERGSVGLAHSLSARAGVVAMTKTLALEWAHLGIRVNCVAPGVVITEALPENVSASLQESVVPESVPAGRATPTEDIAEFIAFLATPAARMITGQLLQIDGAAHLGRGLHMLPDWPPLEDES